MILKVSNSTPTLFKCDKRCIWKIGTSVNLQLYWSSLQKLYDCSYVKIFITIKKEIILNVFLNSRFKI